MIALDSSGTSDLATEARTCPALARPARKPPPDSIRPHSLREYHGEIRDMSTDLALFHTLKGRSIYK